MDVCTIVLLKKHTVPEVSSNIGWLNQNWISGRHVRPCWETTEPLSICSWNMYYTRVHIFSLYTVNLFDFESFYIHCPGWYSISLTNQPLNVSKCLFCTYSFLGEASSHAGSKPNSTAGEGQPSTKSLQCSKTSGTGKSRQLGGEHTLQGTNISHLVKRNIIFKTFPKDMLVPWRVCLNGLVELKHWYMCGYLQVLLLLVLAKKTTV